MTRTGLCARPACGGPVAAWFTYDYAGQQVWLDDAGPDAGPDGGGSRWALCAGHAERLRPPRGWVIQDRRTAPVAGPSQGRAGVAGDSGRLLSPAVAG
jgi:hypothetical protein